MKPEPVAFPGLCLWALIASSLLAVSGCATEPKPLSPPPSPSDAAFQKLETERARFREKKVALINEALELEPSEKDPFWGEYYAYDAELKKLYDDRYRLIRDYARNYREMTNEIADNLAQRALRGRQARDDLMRKYYYRVKKATSAITAARFIQIENEINLLSDLKISSEIPFLPKGSLPSNFK
jgi:hypothetical protein